MLPHVVSCAGTAWQNLSLSWSTTGFNLESSFYQTSCSYKAKEPSLPYYLPMAGGKIVGSILFPGIIVLCEIPTGLFRNWIQEVESTSMINMLYCGKEEIHSQIELIIYYLKWYSPTNIISVMSEVSLTTDRDLSVLMCLRNRPSFIPPWYWKSRGTSHYTTNQMEVGSWAHLTTFKI